MVKVVLAVLLSVVGIMILIDTFLRAFTQGLQGDQIPTLASGTLCLIGGSYFWRSRRHRRDQTPQPTSSPIPPTDSETLLQEAPATGGETRVAFRDPFAGFNAGSNVEAHLVCGLLEDAGIRAMVIEDVSQVGVWFGGTVAEIHKPQVWIERANTERARVVLTDYERRNAERRGAGRGAREMGQPVAVVCDECAKRSEFPAAQRGTVQSCPHCRAYVDVGDSAGPEGWDKVAGEDEA